MRKIFFYFVSFLIVLSLFSSVLAWDSERPRGHVTINERAENSATDGKASVGVGVHVVGYLENWPEWPSLGCDLVELRIIGTANTRQIISYSVQSDYYSWHANLPNTASLGDDGIFPCFMGGIKVRFYGGGHSAEYDSVWIGSNGFISFDPNRTFTDPYYQYSIPSLSGPNTFVAPFWRDLKPNEGGTITYGDVWHWPGFGPEVHCFCVSYNNVPDKYGSCQMFQILLEDAPTGGNKHRQSRIWFQYEWVTKNDQTTIGIEDQQGGRGISYSLSDIGSGMTLLFKQSSNSAFVGYLKITMTESETDADTAITQNAESLRGINVILDSDLPDEQRSFATALAGGATLLLDAIELGMQVPKWISGAGFMIGAFFYVADWAQDMARQEARAKLLQTDNYHTYAKARAVDDPDGCFFSDAVDANFGILAYWILQDPNNNRHDLNITSELGYCEYDVNGGQVSAPIITTTTTLSMYPEDNNNNNKPTAPTITSGTYSNLYIGAGDEHDYYKIYANSGQRISFSASKTSSETQFYLFMYNPAGTQVASTGPGNNLYMNYFPDSEGYWILEVRAYVYSGLYSMTTSVITVPPGGGGCPILYVRGESCYDSEGLLDIHNPDCIDVVRNHTLGTTPASINGLYSMRLVEHPQTHSYIDQVKLYAILENNMEITLPLVWAWHSEHGFVWPQLLLSDDWRIETIGADYNNGTSQSIELRFVALPPNIRAKAYIFQIEGYNPHLKR
jgi:hypothetical protein